MPLKEKGLIKLSEECGELVQAAMKRIAFRQGDIHWDGSNLQERLADEIADVLAACTMVQKLHKLDIPRIEKRMMKKIELFAYWDEGGKETTVPEGYKCAKDAMPAMIMKLEFNPGNAELSARLEEAEAVIEHYGKKENWDYYDGTHSYFNSTRHGYDKAAEYLAKHTKDGEVKKTAKTLTR